MHLSIQSLDSLCQVEKSVNSSDLESGKVSEIAQICANSGPISGVGVFAHDGFRPSLLTALYFAAGGIAGPA